MSNHTLNMNDHPTTLLQTGEANTKTNKNNLLTWSLSLAQHTLSGRNVCPHATPGCIASCVGKAGLVGVFPMILQARIRKTNWFFNDRESFLARLKRELDNANKYCAKHSKKGLIRLNTFSDIRWDRMIDTKVYKNLRFYDYTKSLESAKASIGTNYRRIYSVNEQSNMDEVIGFVKSGGTAAVVFGDVEYQPAHGKIGKLPKTWNGLRVVDGDASDDRYNDPKGVIVGLRLKGTKAARAAACASGFARESKTVMLTVGGK